MKQQESISQNKQADTSVSLGQFSSAYSYNVCSIQEAADSLGISCQAVHKRIKAGTLKAKQNNRRWEVETSSIEYATIHFPKPGRPYTAKRYILMNGPYRVLSFSYQEASGSFTPHEVFDGARAPLGTITRNGKGNPTALKDWWEHRCIPESRERLDRKLAELGVKRPSLIPFRNLGLSLSDQYWVCPEHETINWADINYFDNAFGPLDVNEQFGKNTLYNRDSWSAQIGLSSPDNTSEGVLPKRWICKDNERFLLKGHCPWSDQQVYNELVATALYRRILLPHNFVPYDMFVLGHSFLEHESRKIKTIEVASSCACFLNSDEEYVSAATVLAANTKHRGETDYDALIRFTDYLGLSRKEVTTWLSKIIVCDTILANSDRHLRNFGFIRNIESLKWEPAPIFDSGNCLWYDADEGAVAKNDYSYTPRPFGDTPVKMLSCCEDFSWLDINALDGFSDEAVEILSESTGAMWRLDYIKHGIEAQITLVKQFI